MPVADLLQELESLLEKLDTLESPVLRLGSAYGARRRVRPGYAAFSRLRNATPAMVAN